MGSVRVESNQSGTLVEEIDDDVTQNHGNESPGPLVPDLHVDRRIILHQIHQRFPVILRVVGHVAITSNANEEDVIRKPIYSIRTLPQERDTPEKGDPLDVKIGRVIHP